MRRTSTCAAAPSTPISMVAHATHSSTSWATPASGQNKVTRRISAYTPTLVSRPANSADTGVHAT